MTGNSAPWKERAHAIIDELPDSATWEDLAHEADLRASLERGLLDSEAGRVVSLEDLMSEFGIDK